MKIERNIVAALGALLLIAGGYYWYNKRHENVKVQTFSNVSCSGTNCSKISAAIQ